MTDGKENFFISLEVSEKLKNMCSLAQKGLQEKTGNNKIGSRLD